MDDIDLHPIGNSFSQLSFVPDIRNNLILQITAFPYVLHDIQLLGEDRNPYGQPSQHGISTSEFEELGK
jgi:hypothetical protein